MYETKIRVSVGNKQTISIFVYCDKHEFVLMSVVGSANFKVVVKTRV